VTARATLRPPTVVDLIRHHASSVPERPALVGFDGGERRAWSYGQLDAVTDRIAVGLRRLGLEAGDRLALCMDNSAATDFYRLLHGSYKASVVPVPINSRLAPPEVAHIVRDSGARLLVLPATAHRAMAGEDLAGVAVRDLDVVAEVADADGDPPAPPGLDDPADLLYTSGTTGRPKGARFRHRALGAFAGQLSATLRMVGDDVLQTPAPVYTSTGTHTLPLPVLAVGGTYVVEPGFNVSDSAARLNDEGASLYFAVPAIWILLLESLPAAAAFPRLHSLMYGGSIMPEPIIARLLIRFPHSGLWNLYGLTEAGPNGTVLPPERALSHPGSVGVPLDGTRIRIVDDQRRDVPTGALGEVLIQAPSLMDGYHNMERATAEALVEGWLHTGDIGRCDEDGMLYIVDRKTDMIVRGGFNVYPAEVEAVLLEHPDVAEAAVVGVPHGVLGEDVAAVVATRPGAESDQASLEAFCRGRLADFKRPRQWRFVDELPRNSMGKLLKRQLRDGWLAARAPPR
jgi:acyl-CoA synthetase (AMP-forming)/AMP-acid ligase II